MGVFIEWLLTLICQQVKYKLRAQILKIVIEVCRFRVRFSIC